MLGNSQVFKIPQMLSRAFQWFSFTGDMHILCPRLLVGFGVFCYFHIFNINNSRNLFLETLHIIVNLIKHMKTHCKTMETCMNEKLESDGEAGELREGDA